jgi:hypothetical protein
MLIWGKHTSFDGSLLERRRQIAIAQNIQIMCFGVEIKVMLIYSHRIFSLLPFFLSLPSFLVVVAIWLF